MEEVDTNNLIWCVRLDIDISSRFPPVVSPILDSESIEVDHAAPLLLPCDTGASHTPHTVRWYKDDSELTSEVQPSC